MTNRLAAWSWHHTGLVVDDLDTALAFYREAFGFEVVFEARGMTDLIQQIVGAEGLECDLAQLRSRLSGQVLELLAFRGVPDDVDADLPVVPGRAHVAFKVVDLDAALAELDGRGAATLGAVTHFPEGRAVYCRERSGTVFELQEARSDR